MKTITATVSLKLAETAFHKNVPMNSIIVDGWSRGLMYEQTLHECIQSGYAMCICEPAIKREWARMDAEYLAYEQDSQLDW